MEMHGLHWSGSSGQCRGAVGATTKGGERRPRSYTRKYQPAHSFSLYGTPIPPQKGPLGPRIVPLSQDLEAKLVQPQHAAACRSMPQHAAACSSTFFLELHMGVLKHAAACRSVPQHAAASQHFHMADFFFHNMSNM